MARSFTNSSGLAALVLPLLTVAACGPTGSTSLDANVSRVDSVIGNSDAAVYHGKWTFNGMNFTTIEGVGGMTCQMGNGAWFQTGSAKPTSVISTLVLYFQVEPVAGTYSSVALPLSNLTTTTVHVYLQTPNSTGGEEQWDSDVGGGSVSVVKVNGKTKASFASMTVTRVSPTSDTATITNGELTCP